MQWNSLRVLALGLAVAGSSSGCFIFTSKQEGDRLKTEVATLRTRLDQADAKKKETLAALAKAHADLGELKDVLPRARDLLLQSSARVSARLDQIESTITKLQGRQESLETDLGAYNKYVSGMKGQVTAVTDLAERLRTELSRLMIEVRRASPEPRTAAELFARATIHRLTGKYPEARQDYAAFLQKYPTDLRAEAAHLQLAQTHFDAYDFKAAILATAALLKAHPDGKLAGAGRLLSARSHVELKRCVVAIRILTRMLQTTPTAEEAPAAQSLLNHLRRVQKLSRYCTPGA